MRNSAGKFLKIVCPRCSSNQIVFGKAASLIKCKNCNRLLMKTTGGKSRIRAHIKQIYGIK